MVTKRAAAQKAAFKNPKARAARADAAADSDFRGESKGPAGRRCV